MSFELVCIRCGNRHDASEYRLSCDRCEGLLDVEYSSPAGTARVNDHRRGMQRYLPSLPVADPANFVTLGEGDTPVVPLAGIGKYLGNEHLFAKLEYVNPTGSFKDRGNAVQVSVLKELGIAVAADVAEGNAGHSFACYCARASIAFIGFVYDDPEHPKVRAVALTGAEIHRVEGDRNDCRKAIARFCEDSGTVNMFYVRNAYFIEGQKTIAYEIAEQMDPLPDHIIVPVSNGSILLGLWRGFSEMLRDGRVASMPHLHGVQPDAFQPLAAAFDGRDWRAAPQANTIAAGIKTAEPPRLDSMLGACKASGGQAIAVSDNGILLWQRRLAEQEGIFVEPTSATVLAGAEELVRRRVISKDERVLMPLTGFGFKEPIPINVLANLPSPTRRNAQS